MAFLRKFSDFSLNLSRLVFLWGRFGLSDVPFQIFSMVFLKRLFT